MFKIDLLEEQGIPVRSTAAGLAVAATASALPVIILIIIVSFFMTNSVNISLAEQGLARFTSMKEHLSDEMSTAKSIEQGKSKINNSLDEVSSSFYRHSQWTGILMMIAENMPEAMLLTELQVKQNVIRKPVPKKGNPEEMLQISVPVRTLRMKVSGSSGYDCAKAVKDFRDRLRYSDVLKDKIVDVRVSQEAGTTENHDKVYYEIECEFKPGL
ncbi:MAG: hypothetical protein E4H40_04680 [Candidatus Brocadiia bacterium]|nr:MAG: hypothetical protein E4H40_04680 [Candidatus Brocadiia bacterium]